MRTGPVAVRRWEITIKVSRIKEEGDGLVEVSEVVKEETVRTRAGQLLLSRIKLSNDKCVFG